MSDFHKVFTYELVATDKGTPDPKSSSLECEVDVRDKNDVAPVFVFPPSEDIIYTNDVSMTAYMLPIEGATCYHHKGLMYLPRLYLPSVL